jgi:hypothetical protein
MLVTRIGRTAATSLLVLAGSAQAASRPCGDTRADAAAVDRTIRSLFDALAHDDAAAVGRLTTASFYAFDAGKRFSAAQLSAAVRDAHAKGVKLSWSLGTIDAHVGCDMAWAAWENRGSAGIPPEVTPITWLESAMLKRTGTHWRIDFFHSSRVPSPVRSGD